MDKQGQIETIAKTIGVVKGYGCKEDDNCQRCICRSVDCLPYELAQVLFASGYRKESDTAREIIAYLRQFEGFANIAAEELEKQYVKEG